MENYYQLYNRETRSLVAELLPCPTLQRGMVIRLTATGKSRAELSDVILGAQIKIPGAWRIDSDGELTVSQKLGISAVKFWVVSLPSPAPSTYLFADVEDENSALQSWISRSPVIDV